MSREPVRLPEDYQECLDILQQNQADIVFDVATGGYSLSWEHGTMYLCIDIDKSKVIAATFVVLWNTGIDCGDAIRLAQLWQGDIG